MKIIHFFFKVPSRSKNTTLFNVCSTILFPISITIYSFLFQIKQYSPFGICTFTLSYCQRSSSATQLWAPRSSKFQSANCPPIASIRAATLWRTLYGQYINRYPPPPAPKSFPPNAPAFNASAYSSSTADWRSYCSYAFCSASHSLTACQNCGDCLLTVHPSWHKPVPLPRTSRQKHFLLIVLHLVFMILAETWIFPV